MPHDINVESTGWQQTGSNVRIPQYRMIVTLNYLDDARVRQTVTRTVLFPDILADLPVSFVKREMELFILRVARFFVLNQED